MQSLLMTGFSICVVALISGVFYMVHLRAQRYIHPQRLARADQETPANYGVSYQNIEIVTSDGLTLRAWYTPSENGSVILVAHGYKDKRPADMHGLFARNKYGVVTWDFRAQGESDGKMCTLGYYETRDVEAALDFVLSQPEVKQVGAWGGSMGGAAVIMAAARRHEIGALVADSTYAALEDEFQTMVPIAFLRPLLHFFAQWETGLSVDAVRPEDDIGQISPRPVFIIQGQNDRRVLANSGQRLYDAAGEPRSLWVGQGVGHLMMFNTFPQEYERRVISFFDNSLPTSQQTRVLYKEPVGIKMQ